MGGVLQGWHIARVVSGHYYACGLVCIYPITMQVVDDVKVVLGTRNVKHTCISDPAYRGGNNAYLETNTVTNKH